MTVTSKIFFRVQILFEKEKKAIPFAVRESLVKMVDKLDVPAAIDESSSSSESQQQSEGRMSGDMSVFSEPKEVEAKLAAASLECNLNNSHSEMVFNEF